MKRIFITSFILFCFYTNIQSTEKWLTKKVLFYNVNYTNADIKNIKNIINFIVQFDKKMKSVLNTDRYNISFEDSKVELFLYPKDSKEIELYRTSGEGSTVRKNNKEIYNGTFKLQGIEVYPEKNYFYKQFASGLAGIYLHLLCSVNDISYSNLEGWFRQGIKDYLSIYYSTDYWKNEGYKTYLKRLITDPDGIKTNLKLLIKNDYRDGFLMICMLNDIYGFEKIIELLLYKDNSFEKKVKNVLKLDFKKFLQQIDKWKKDTGKLVEKY